MNRTNISRVYKLAAFSFFGGASSLVNRYLKVAISVAEPVGTRPAQITSCKT